MTTPRVLLYSITILFFLSWGRLVDLNHVTSGVACCGHPCSTWATFIFGLMSSSWTHFPMSRNGRGQSELKLLFFFQLISWKQKACVMCHELRLCMRGTDRSWLVYTWRRGPVYRMMSCLYCMFEEQRSAKVNFQIKAQRDKLTLKRRKFWHPVLEKSPAWMMHATNYRCDYVYGTKQIFFLFVFPEKTEFLWCCMSMS